VGVLDGEDLDGSVGGDAWGEDCAHTVVVSANANAPSATAVEPLKSALIPRLQREGGLRGCAASLHCLDVSICSFGNKAEE